MAESVAVGSSVQSVTFKPPVTVARAATPPRGTPKYAPRTASSDPPTGSMRAPQLAVPESPARWRKLGGLAAVLVLLVSVGAFTGRHYLMAPAFEDVSSGTLAMSTNPPGAQVVVDGQMRGVTPLTMTLAAGPHKVELRSANNTKIVPVSIAGGTNIAQYIELPRVAGNATGQLQIRTEPAGAKISVDGVARGTAPVTVADLAPGEHSVILESDLGSMKQTVTVEPGVTASLVVPLAAPEGAPVSGWIAVTSPVEMQLFEKDRLLGTSRTDRLMVSAGRHEIDIVNDDLGYRSTRTLQVPAGKVAALNIEMPSGSVALNAQPWAEVWIDGNRVGETPIGNVSLSIGKHDVVFRHPELGEQHHTVTVTMKNVERLSVDMRKP